MNLKTLITEARKGTKKAQQMLFQTTCAQLNSVALRYVADQSLAQDVLQETYIRVFKHLDKFEYRDDASTLAWMKRITATEALRLIKKRKRWQETDLHDHPTIISSTAFADECMLSKVIITAR